MPENNLGNLITAVGSICEMCGMLRDGLMRNGFTREEACEMVGIFIVNTLQHGG